MGGTGERGGGSGLEFFFFCDPSLSFYSRCFEAYKHIYPGPSYFFLRAKEGLIFYFFFLFHKIFLPSLFPIPPYPTPFHHKKSNGRSLIASKQGLFLTQRAYDIYTTSFALINVDAISWHCIVDAILSQRLSARTLGRIC